MSPISKSMLKTPSDKTALIFCLEGVTGSRTNLSNLPNLLSTQKKLIVDFIFGSDFHLMARMLL